MTNLLLSKQQRDAVFERVKTLESDLKIASENETYYRCQLHHLRAELVDIFNLSGATTRVPDSESVEQSWQRYVEAIKEKLNETS